MTFLKSTVVKYLRDVADLIEEGKCNPSDEQSLEIMSVIANLELSKALACTFLNMSRSNFDKYIREGKLPKGRKIKGFTELRWNKKDLIGIKFNP